MKRSKTDFMPLARQKGSVIQALVDEVLADDLERHRAHCLNPVAAATRDLGDGHTSVAQMVSQLRANGYTMVTDGGELWSAPARQVSSPRKSASGGCRLVTPSSIASGRHGRRRGTPCGGVDPGTDGSGGRVMHGQRTALCEFPLLHRPLRRWYLCCLTGEGHEMACAPQCWISNRQA